MLKGHGNHLCKIEFWKFIAYCQWSVGSTYQVSRILPMYHLRGGGGGGGVTQLEFLVNKLWQDGPKVPQKHEKQSDVSVDVPSKCLEELSVSEKRTVHSLLASEIVERGMENLVENHNYSSLI